MTVTDILKKWRDSLENAITGTDEQNSNALDVETDIQAGSAASWIVNSARTGRNCSSG